MKRGTPDHPKTGDLADRLGIEPFAAVGLLELLWHYAGKYSPRGDVGKFPNKALASGMKWERDPDELITALIESRWLDENKRHRLIVHDWPDHCEESVKKALLRSNSDFLADYGASAGQKSSSIYFLYSPTVDRVKIGFTEGNVSKRIDSLQTGSAEKLVLIGTIPGSRYQETQLHKKWAQFRRDGEWFELSGDFFAYLNETFSEFFGSRNNPSQESLRKISDEPNAARQGMAWLGKARKGRARI